jgi:hypothetical protein
LEFDIKKSRKEEDMNGDRSDKYRRGERNTEERRESNKDVRMYTKLSELPVKFSEYIILHLFIYVL